jgi:signal transduction histidine kinase
LWPPIPAERAPLTVLLVEDDENDVQLLRRALLRDRVESVALIRVARVDAAVARLTQGGIDAILLDLTLPDSQGLETVRRVHAAAPGVPIVVLTGVSDSVVGLSAVQAGAQDYLSKHQLDGRLLHRALRYAVERQRHQDQGRLLAQEQLARAAAEEALRARDEFLSVAAHELYTPITALKLSAQSAGADLGARDRATALKRRLDIIERQARRLGRLVESLLEVSRIRVGRFELVLERVDLARVVAEVAAELQPEAGRSGSELRLHGHTSSIGRWDRDRLEQVVTNLITNAIKYGGGQPIDITIEGDADAATLSVTDHGIGIPPDMQVRIFERFERAVPVRQYGGLGLGLYVVRRIVRDHGGSVRLASTVGKGTTFSVELPRGGPRPATRGESPREVHDR